MCEPTQTTQTCPFVAPVYRGCDRVPPEEGACLDRGCFWDGAACGEPLLRAALDGDHPKMVVGIDTGSAFTVLAPGVGACTPARARAARDCAGDTSACTTLRYGSGPVDVVPLPAGAPGEVVPYCAGRLFPQDHDALVGVTPVAANDPRAPHSLMNQLPAQERRLVVDQDAGTVCIGQHCRARPPGAPGVEARPLYAPPGAQAGRMPVIQHGADQLLLLDTGSTRTHDITERVRARHPDLAHRVCIIGNKDLRYLEVRPGAARYQLAAGAAARCAAGARAA